MSLWADPASVVKEARERPGLLEDARIRSLVPDFVERMQYLDTLTYLPDDILTKLDRASMGVSLESRVPFMDHELLAFAWRLPLKMRIREGKGKWIHKERKQAYGRKKEQRHQQNQQH